MTTPPTPPEPPKPPKYLTYVPNRKSRFKTHTNIGHAKNGMGMNIPNVEGGVVRTTMWVWELRDAEYELLWTIERGTPVEDLPWKVKLYKPYKPPIHTSCHCDQCRT